MLRRILRLYSGTTMITQWCLPRRKEEVVGTLLSQVYRKSGVELGLQTD